MAKFYGTYPSTLDSKGRFLLPVGIKKQLPETENSFMLSSGFDECINLYTMEQWNNKIDELSQLDDNEPKVRDYRRKLMGSSSLAEMDSAGRLLISSLLRDYGKLGKDIIIMSAFDKFEIMDVDKYNKLFEGLSSDEFSKLAAEANSFKKKKD